MTTLTAIRRLEVRASRLKQQSNKMIALVKYCPDCEPTRYFVGGEVWSEADLNRVLEEQRSLEAPAGTVIFRPLHIGECNICGFKNYPDYADS